MGNDFKKELPPSYDKIYNDEKDIIVQKERELKEREEREQKEKNQENATELTKLLFLNSNFDEKLFNLFVKKNIKISHVEIPESFIKKIIHHKYTETFKKLFDNIDDKYEFLNSIVANNKLFEYIIVKKYYDALEYIFEYLNFDFNDTIAHMIFWYNDYQSIMLLTKQKKDLLFKKNNIGFTPFDYFLLGSYLNKKFFTVEEIDNLINLIGGNYFILLSKNKTNDSYTVNDTIKIPEKFSFVDIIKLICDKSDEQTKKIFTDLGKKICEKMLE